MSSVGDAAGVWCDLSETRVALDARRIVADPTRRGARRRAGHLGARRAPRRRAQRAALEPFRRRVCRQRFKRRERAERRG